MNKSSALLKDMPATEHTFQVDVEGEVTKKTYAGEFTCKIPRRKDQCLIDKHRALLNGDVPDQLTPATLRFHHMISYLRYTLIEFPKFWKDSDRGYELYDENVVAAIYDKVLSFEETWLKTIWGEEAMTKFKGSDEEVEEKTAGPV
jgi:hypothetical protein